MQCCYSAFAAQHVVSTEWKWEYIKFVYWVVACFLICCIVTRIDCSKHVPAKTIPKLVAQVSCSHDLDPCLAVCLFLLRNLGHNIILPNTNRITHSLTHSMLHCISFCLTTLILISITESEPQSTRLQQILRDLFCTIFFTLAHIRSARLFARTDAYLVVKINWQRSCSTLPSQQHQLACEQIASFSTVLIHKVLGWLNVEGLDRAKEQAAAGLILRWTHAQC